MSSTVSTQARPIRFLLNAGAVERCRGALDSSASICFVLVGLLSSAYCLLAYIPTTYFAFIQAPFQSWMPAFSRVQPWLFTLTFAVTAVPVFKRLRASRTRWLAIEFLFSGTLASCYLLVWRPVQLLRNNSASFVWALAFLIPLVCLGALEYRTWLPGLKELGTEPRSASYRRVITAALMISTVSPGATYVRYAMAGMNSGALPKTALLGWVWAAVTQICLFVFVFSLVELALQSASRSAFPRRARFLAYSALWWVGGAVVFYKVILASVPFSGTEATIYAVVFSLALVSFLGGVLLRRRVNSELTRLQEMPASTSIAGSGKVQLAGSWVILLTAPITVPAFIGILDWNSVLEKSWAILYWIIVTALIVYKRPGKSERRSWPLLIVASLSMLVFQIGAHSQKSWGRIFFQDQFDSAGFLRRQAAVDPSFLAASELMAPLDFRFCGSLCQLIHQQTNIPASAATDLHDLTLVQKLQPVVGSKPNIFIIVVDSLRQDYVSPYNPDVTFTPAIQAFAADSVVFRNAFTRYSGTTLAEPSIWAGMLLLHKHYVQPFHLVNNLEKLAQVDGYQKFVTTDTVLRVLLQPAADTVQLDAQAQQWTDIDFCSTAAEAARRVTERADSTQPVFLYTQPQNIHFVTLTKTAAIRRPRRSYAPFLDDYYASELERLDGCFGNFIRSLKNAGLYDNSIIVLTADHGEALQQAGAERHAFSLRPHVIRIPLIVHVPPKVKQSWYYDPDLISFNTDIAATIYELLGHGPVVSQAEFGRPLFTRTKPEMDQYKRESYMIASSYGPLYGLLSDNGGKLFIAHEDGEEFFDLRRDPEATHNALTEEIRRNSEAQLRQDIEGIAHLYGYTYQPPTILDWLMR